MNTSHISRKQLDEAFRRCGCKGDLDTALMFPALAIALKNVSETIEARRLRSLQRIDFKRATAGDFDN